MKFFILLRFAHRYLCTSRKLSRFFGSFSSWVRVCGIIVGVVALIGTTAVMNGLQNSYLSAVLEVGSYHVRIYSHGVLSDSILSKIRNYSNVLLVQPLLESQTLFRSSMYDMRPIFLRAMSQKSYTNDKGFYNKLNLVSGNFPEKGEILLGEVLYKNLMLQERFSLSMVTLSEGKLAVSIMDFPISGIFKTGYYEYDRNLAIINFSDGFQHFMSKKEIFYGVKLMNPLRKTDSFVKSLGNLGLDAASWQDHNRALLEALRLEKNVMIFLLFLILFVVGFGIFQDRVREIEERSEDIAILRVLGCTLKNIQGIFILQGLILGLIGVGLACVLGFTLIFNIDPFFKIIETLANFPTALGRLTGLWNMNSVHFFSGEDFYLTRIPIMVRLPENIFFCVFPLFCIVFCSVCASMRVFKYKPLETLKSY